MSTRSPESDSGSGTDAAVLVEIDEPAAGVRRLTLNRPEKRNALSNALRGALLEALREADRDEAARVTIIRGAGSCFSSGYDLASDLGSDQPYFTAEVGMQWARHVSEGWMSIWDLAKPVIAQVHGHAMAGGLELMGACDLAYAASDARLSHPVTRFALPDFDWFPVQLSVRHAMELQVAGREFSGEEAAGIGLVNQAFPPDELESRVLEVAERIAQAPTAVLAVNKRAVYTALEARGGRSVVRTIADLQAGPHLQKLGGQEMLVRMKRSRTGDRD